MSLPDDTVYAFGAASSDSTFTSEDLHSPGFSYIQAHALAYIMKLYIEMNLAELIGKVIKKSNKRRNSHTAANGHSWEPNQAGEMFNREWRDTVQQVLQPTGGQMHSLDTRGLGVVDGHVASPAEAHCRKGSLGSSMEPLSHHSQCTCSETMV